MYVKCSSHPFGRSEGSLPHPALSLHEQRQQPVLLQLPSLEAFIFDVTGPTLATAGREHKKKALSAGKPVAFAVRTHGPARKRFSIELFSVFMNFVSSPSCWSSSHISRNTPKSSLSPNGTRGGGGGGGLRATATQNFCNAFVPNQHVMKVMGHRNKALRRTKSQP